MQKKNTHCVANRSGGMERSCNYLLRISQNTKKKKSFKKKERKAILNIAIQHRDALFLACFFALNVKGRKKKKSKHPHTCDQLGLKFP